MPNAADANPLLYRPVKATLIHVVVTALVTVILATALPIAFSMGRDGILISIVVYLTLAVITVVFATRQVPEFSHTSFAVLLMLLYLLVCVPLSYSLLSFNFPLADPWLARADAFLGIHVPSITETVLGIEWVAATFSSIYFLFLPELAVLILLLGVVIKDFRSLWELVFHFQFTCTTCLLVSTFTPALGAFQWYGFESILNQDAFIADFEALRMGNVDNFSLSALEGLVSFPSFHTAGAVAMSWSLRRRPLLFWSTLPLNAGIVTSTVLTGAHYFTDVLAGCAVCVFSALIYRRWIEDVDWPMQKTTPSPR